MLCMYCSVLYCTVLYCTALYCTVLYCSVLYVLFCTLDQSTEQYQIRDGLALLNASLAAG